MITPGLSGLGKIRGQFIISGGPSAHRFQAVVSEQTAVFASALFQENGSKSNTRAGQKAGLFNHLEAQPATAAVGGTCHSWFARDPEPDAHSQTDTWALRQPVRSTKQNRGAYLSLCIPVKRAHSPKEESHFTGSGWGKGRGANIQVLLDNYFQPCPTSVQQFDAIHQQPRCI